MSGFNYENKEVILQKGGKTIRKVSIKKGTGYKSITKYRKGKKITIKKPIHKEHIKLIKKGKFIPGLFNNCKNCKTKKQRGGDDEDLEMGPNISDIKPYPVPPDPLRIKRYEEQFRRRSVTPSEVEKTFSGPNPEEKEGRERGKMADEDPLNKDPFEREPLQIFSSTGGKI